MPTSSSQSTTGRARLAALSLLGSVVAAPAGAYLEWGLGVAALVAAGVLFVVAMLLGWT